MSGTGWHLSTSFCYNDIVIVSVQVCALSIVKDAVLTSVCISPSGLASLTDGPPGRSPGTSYISIAPEGRFPSLLSSVSVTTYLAGQALSGSCSNSSCHSQAWFNRTLAHISCYLSFASCPRDSLFTLMHEALGSTQHPYVPAGSQAGPEILPADIQT